MGGSEGKLVDTNSPFAFPSEGVKIVENAATPSSSGDVVFGSRVFDENTSATWCVRVHGAITFGMVVSSKTKKKLIQDVDIYGVRLTQTIDQNGSKLVGDTNSSNNRHRKHPEELVTSSQSTYIPGETMSVSLYRDASTHESRLRIVGSQFIVTIHIPHTKPLRPYFGFDTSGHSIEYFQNGFSKGVAFACGKELNIGENRLSASCTAPWAEGYGQYLCSQTSIQWRIHIHCDMLLGVCLPEDGVSTWNALGYYFMLGKLRYEQCTPQHEHASTTRHTDPFREDDEVVTLILQREMNTCKLHMKSSKLDKTIEIPSVGRLRPFLCFRSANTAEFVECDPAANKVRNSRSYKVQPATTSSFISTTQQLGDTMIAERKSSESTAKRDRDRDHRVRDRDRSCCYCS